MWWPAAVVGAAWNRCHAFRVVIRLYRWLCVRSWRERIVLIAVRIARWLLLVAVVAIPVWPYFCIRRWSHAGRRWWDVDALGSRALTIAVFLRLESDQGARRFLDRIGREDAVPDLVHDAGAVTFFSLLTRRSLSLPVASSGHGKRFLFVHDYAPL